MKAVLGALMIAFYITSRVPRSLQAGHCQTETLGTAPPVLSMEWKRNSGT
jgi:hypothetical protein